MQKNTSDKVNQLVRELTFNEKHKVANIVRERADKFDERTKAYSFLYLKKSPWEKYGEFTVNSTAREIIVLLKQERTIGDVVGILSKRHNKPSEEIANFVVGFIRKLAVYGVLR